MNSYSGVFNNADTLLALSASYGALNSGKTKMELVKEEARNICSTFKPSGPYVRACCIVHLFVIFSLLL